MDKVAKFPLLYYLAIPRRDLRTKKTKPKIEKLPEGLGVTLEISYIERGQLAFTKMRWKLDQNSSLKTVPV